MAENMKNRVLSQKTEQFKCSGIWNSVYLEIKVDYKLNMSIYDRKYKSTCLKLRKQKNWVFCLKVSSVFIKIEIDHKHIMSHLWHQIWKTMFKSQKTKNFKFPGK